MYWNKMQNKTGGPGVELWGGSRRLTSRSRRAAFAALTPPPTDTLGSASVCGSAWSLADMIPACGTSVILQREKILEINSDFPTRGCRDDGFGAVAEFTGAFDTWGGIIFTAKGEKQLSINSENKHWGSSSDF